MSVFAIFCKNGTFWFIRSHFISYQNMFVFILFLLRSFWLRPGRSLGCGRLFFSTSWPNHQSRLPFYFLFSDLRHFRGKIFVRLKSSYDEKCPDMSLTWTLVIFINELLVTFTWFQTFSIKIGFSELQIKTTTPLYLVCEILLSLAVK